MSVPRHVLTGDYLGSPYGTTSIRWSAAAPFLTWAQVSAVNANAVWLAGIKTQYYVDPNRAAAADGDPFYTSNQETFAHNCGGSRVYQANAGQIQYVMAIGTSAMRELFATYVNSIVRGKHFDAVFEDQAGPLPGLGTYSSMPCGYSNSDWLAYGDALNAASSVPIIFNGLSGYYNESVSLSTELLAESRTIGGNLEHCYSDDSHPEIGSWPWAATENTELQVEAKQKLFFCMLRNTNGATTQDDERIYAYASFLLTYNPSTSVLWEEFATAPSDLHVMPESQLVPLEPTTATPVSISHLEQPGGTYARQYASCYYKGVSVGACAVVVNPSYAPQRFPFTQYHHSLLLRGGGVLDGGSISTSGPAPSSVLGGLRAAIVFP